MASRTGSALVPRGEGESSVLPGVEVISKVTRDMSGGAYSVFVNVAQPGSGVPMHTHLDDEETMVVVRGRIVCRLGDERLAAGPGDMVHLPAGVPHGWSTDGDAEVQLIVVFSLTERSDYERMFRDIARTDLDDFDAAHAVAGANRMLVPLPPEFV